ncbi:DUF2285 domain-containing protein [Bradyrhizobium sp. SZCCHNR3107]|uniref:DUF2285 domain-containing protein n=2 Tax=Bradyrhizobium TaxID=374 RepID=UPI0028E448DC|nr:DUF2285 domain-containing protein [Bradyrhizobium sp. SZCCHNR3107]
MPSLLPDAFELRPSAYADSDPASMPISLPTLSGLDARAAEDGKWHGLWRSAVADHQFWLSDPPPGTKTAYVVILPVDALLEHRAEAVLRFWRTLTGRPNGERHHALPAQTRDRHILILRALDGRTDGASYRKIAEALLGFRGNKTDWESDPRKNQTRRLVADGTHYMRGGYRELLHYPTRLPPR